MVNPIDNLIEAILLLTYTFQKPDIKMNCPSKCKTLP